jgi:polar amino acid transport system substrate-binding protein
VLASRNPHTGELQGVAVSLSRQLGLQLSATVELVGYDTVARLVAGSKSNAWDVAFLAIDPARAGELAFTAPYMEVEVTYLVPQQSELRTAPEVDRAGVRIALQERNAADLFLSKNLKRASLVRTLDEMGAFELLKAGAAEAFASNKQRLLSVVKSNPGYRVLEGRFATIQHAAAVPIGHRAAAACLRDFIEGVKASGFVRRALEEAGAHGVVVAPPVNQQTPPFIKEGS